MQSLRSTLTSWEERLSSLDDQCQKLLLFSTQKFLRMYHIMQGITSTREMVDFLMKEMAISSSSYQDLTSIIDDAFQVVCVSMYYIFVVLLIIVVFELSNLFN